MADMFKNDVPITYGEMKKWLEDNGAEDDMILANVSNVHVSNARGIIAFSTDNSSL